MVQKQPLMNDQEFRDAYQPLQVPAHFDESSELSDQTLFALAQSGSATADEVVIKLKELKNGDSEKSFIADVHQLLTGWYEKGLIAGIEENGELKYSLQKITEANDGKVNPDLLAPGLD